MRFGLDTGDHPLASRLHDLGVEAVSTVEAKPGHEGMVLVQPGTLAAFGWPGSTIDGWLGDLLSSPQGMNKLSKLALATAQERHLAIVLEQLSRVVDQRVFNSAFG